MREQSNLVKQMSGNFFNEHEKVKKEKVTFVIYLEGEDLDSSHFDPLRRILAREARKYVDKMNIKTYIRPIWRYGETPAVYDYTQKRRGCKNCGLVLFIQTEHRKKKTGLKCPNCSNNLS